MPPLSPAMIRLRIGLQDEFKAILNGVSTTSGTPIRNPNYAPPTFEYRDLYKSHTGILVRGGTTGNNTISLNDSSAIGVPPDYTDTVNLSSFDVNGYDGNDDIRVSTSKPVRIDGGVGADYIVGGNGRDTINGAGGNDSVFGGYGTDIINGDSGDDELRGEWDSDTITGGSGADLMRGGLGDDRFYFGGDGSIDRVYGEDGTDYRLSYDSDDYWLE